MSDVPCGRRVPPISPGHSVATTSTRTRAPERIFISDERTEEMQGVACGRHARYLLASRVRAEFEVPGGQGIEQQVPCPPVAHAKLRDVGALEDSG
jgi:hypothetical protein